MFYYNVKSKSFNQGCIINRMRTMRTRRDEF